MVLNIKNNSIRNKFPINNKSNNKDNILNNQKVNILNNNKILKSLNHLNVYR